MTWRQLANSPHLPWDLNAPGINWEAVRATMFTENAPQYVAQFIEAGGQIQVTHLQEPIQNMDMVINHRLTGYRVDITIADLHSRRAFTLQATTFEFFEQLEFDCHEVLAVFRQRYGDTRQRQQNVVHYYQERKEEGNLARAEAVAHDWLLSNLEPDQREEWTRHQKITIRKPAGHFYVITPGHSMNVLLYTADEKRDGGPYGMCVVCADGRVPQSDQYLMQYLMIKYNERRFAETAAFSMGIRPIWVDGRPTRPENEPRRRAPTHIEQHILFDAPQIAPEELRRLQEAYARDVEQAAFRYQHDVREAERGFQYVGRGYGGNIWQTDGGPIVTGS